ncbi:MAG TPA: PilN domain-containing protein [Gaiellaceae bacterium]
MRAVNLLPRDEGRTRRQPGAVSLTAVLGAVLLTAVLCGWFLTASSGVSDKQAELDARRAELAAIPPPEAPDASQTTLVAEKDARLTLLGQALANRIAWDRVLREVSLVVPDDVWLESMNTSGPDPAAAAAAPPPGQAPTTAAGGFAITGYTYSHDGVARLLARLAVIPHLENVKLGSSVLDSEGPRSVVKFAISADLRKAQVTS